MVCGTLVPISFIVDDAISGMAARLPLYAAIAFILGTLTFLVWKGLLRDDWTPICVAFPGMPCAILLPGSRGIFVMLGVLFPLIALKLLGRKRGTVILACFLAVSMVSILLAANGIVATEYDFTPANVIILTFSALIAYFMGVIDSRQYERHLENLETMFYLDAATGLPNRERLAIDVEGLESREDSGEFVFAIAEIANMTELGLLFGYELTDGILAHAKTSIGSATRTLGGRLYRLHGPSFGIFRKIVPGSPQDFKVRFIDQIARTLVGDTLTLEDREFPLKWRIGAQSSSGNDVRGFLSRADSALKYADRTKAATAWYRADMEERTNAAENLRIYGILRNCFRDGSARIAFQPVFRSESGKLDFREALIRIPDGNGGFLRPDRCLPIAESSGLSRDLSAFVLRAACARAKSSGEAVSVNLFINDVASGKFLETIASEFPEGADGRIIIEILERDEIKDMVSCRENLAEAKRRGCRIALDDFGSGYANFSFLLDLPLDIVKVDGSLVKSMAGNERARALVESLLTFAGRSGMNTVAEYVDCEEAHEDARRMGFALCQGFHLGKPEFL